MTLRLLLIDDDQDTRALIALALGLHPGLAVSMTSRVDAPAVLRRDTGQVDGILLNLKRSDGGAPALLAALRRWAVPVLVLSPRAGESAGSIPGAQGVILKPFDPLALPDRVIALFRQSTAAVAA